MTRGKTEDAGGQSDGKFSNAFPRGEKERREKKVEREEASDAKTALSIHRVSRATSAEFNIEQRKFN